jgi:hypothetical protein
MTCSGSPPFGTFTRTAAGPRRRQLGREDAAQTIPRREPLAQARLHTAAIRAAQYQPEIRQEYRRLAPRKGKIVARALIPKELASIVYFVLRKQEAFKGRFRGHVLTPKPARWPRLASPERLTDA